MTSKPHAVLTIFAAGLAIGTASTTIAQDDTPPTVYLEAHCMKARNADYANVETDLWQPVQQELVNQGRKLSWALYAVRYGDRSRCTHYTVDFYLGREQFERASDFSDVVSKVHPGKDMAGIYAQTVAARDTNESLLWILEDSTDIGAFSHVRINWMSTDDPEAYVKMEREVFKPVHEAMIAGGQLAGWALYRLASPTGSALPFNYSSADLLYTVTPLDNQDEAWATVHPDMDALETMEKMDSIRTLVRSETWDLVARTSPPGG